MEINDGMTIIVVVCIVLVLFGFIKTKGKFLVNFVTRMVTGLALIYVINEVLSGYGYTLHVGLNPISAITTGGLGISGIALLYGVMIRKIL